MCPQPAAAGPGDGGQALSSPGSCLEEFRATPILECHAAHGTCRSPGLNHSFWLSTIESSEMFTQPRPQTLETHNLRTRISRCNVCMNNV
ncbi:MAG: hypothetical protein GY694_15930 [Gammaproteobacteria bacterium]|nr:hypothetical protein [Gammaproteobacteria bacterium]